MHATITLRCPGCKARIKAPRLLIGRRRACPGCAAPFVVGLFPPQDSDPQLARSQRRPGPAAK